MNVIEEAADGSGLRVFKMTNANGMAVRVLDHGAALVSVVVPDRKGQLADVCCGFAQPATYRQFRNYSTTVGRYANRIAKGHFSLDGKEYTLATNNGPNHLHGGPTGFFSKVWKAETSVGEKEATVTFTCTSADGEEGYPGTLHATSVYTLTAKNELKLTFKATTDKPTVVNMCNHAFWNLRGHNTGLVLNQNLQLNADFYVPVDDTLIPTGEIRSVKGTCLDFTTTKAIGWDIAELKDVPGIAGGYDHCLVVRRTQPGQMELLAKMSDPESGRVMTVHTNAPGAQIYSTNFWKKELFFVDGKALGKDGAVYEKNHALAIETEAFPDSPNHPHFPSVVLRPGEHYHHATVHTFFVE